jgi:predicted methyltransferase
LAIGIQETGFSPDYADNPLRLFNTMVKSQEDLDYVDSDPIGFSLKKLSEKFAYAKKLGKKTDEDIIQSWNGYGKLKAGTEDIKNTAYGIDISKEPLDMNKNPVYGKRVKDIRDNILKKNPEVVEIINSFLSPSLK